MSLVVYINRCYQKFYVNRSQLQQQDHADSIINKPNTKKNW